LKYAATRNYGEGAVTYLSPYISRGVISTKQVFKHIQSLDLKWEQCEKLIQELAWRDYWQQVWKHKGDAIKNDLKHPQSPLVRHGLPSAILNACTGIPQVDEAVKALYETGYMHNHMRMYLASITCNIAQAHWKIPAKWLYSHLLDGDLASNNLSWQWVAGANSNKKYYANQDNINTYFRWQVQDTFLDVAYSEFENLAIPEHLILSQAFHFETSLPQKENPILEKDKKTLVYNYYNLSPYWHEGEDVQRVLLLEPSFFKENPVQQKCVNFVLALTQNVPNIKVFVGEFEDLAKGLPSEMILYKEHPSNKHYKGTRETRDCMSGVEGYYPSFFAFWKKVKKEIIY